MLLTNDLQGIQSHSVAGSTNPQSLIELLAIDSLHIQDMQIPTHSVNGMDFLGQ